MLFYPHACIMTEKRARLLEDYVRQGGTLILGCRTACKDETGKCVMQPRPGILRTPTGTDVTEFTFASPAEEAAYALWDGKQYIFVLNYKPQEAVIRLHWAVKSLLHGGVREGEITLPSYGVDVFTIE